MAKKLTSENLIECGLDKATSDHLIERINPLLASLPAAACWREISDTILTPDHPFALHQLLHNTVFADWKGQAAPAWFPTEDEIERTNIAAVMRELNLDSYEALHSWSVGHRADFWRLMIERLRIQFHQKFSEVVDLSQGNEFPRWLADARLNIVESCFNAPSNATAIVFQSEGSPISTMTYGELNALINRVANGFVDAGFQPGDPIAIDMPMNAESVAIYLGTIKAGGVVISIADSFAPDEIQMRLRIANAKGIFTQDYIRRTGKQLPLYPKVIDANAPKAIVLSRGDEPSIELRDGDLTWEGFLSDSEQFDSVSCDPHDHTNILFSSGTTGEPKAIPWMQTTPIKCAVDAYLHHDIQHGDVLAWPTNLGWMMGPWLIYASLINQGTIALYDGTATERKFGEFVQNVRVTMLGVVPSIVRAWKNTGCMKGLDWGAIKAFSSTGECSNSEDMLFLMSLAGYRPVIEYCGGTEIGGGYITGTTIQPAAPATFTTPALGLDIVICDEKDQPTDNGEVFVTPPSIGLSTELLNKDHHEVYFEGTPQLPKMPPLRRHGDGVERLADGYYRIHGRVDDTMNLGGIKVSSAEIEEVLNAVSGIREVAAIAVSPSDGGPSQLVIYAVLLPGADTGSLTSSLQSTIREHLNPLFRIHNVVVVDALPRTASNKIMRRILRDEQSS